MHDWHSQWNSRQLVHIHGRHENWKQVLFEEQAEVEQRSQDGTYGIRRLAKYDGILLDRMLCVCVANLYLTCLFTWSQLSCQRRSLDDEGGRLSTTTLDSAFCAHWKQRIYFARQPYRTEFA